MRGEDSAPLPDAQGLELDVQREQVPEKLPQVQQLHTIRNAKQWLQVLQTILEASKVCCTVLLMHTFTFNLFIYRRYFSVVASLYDDNNSV